MQRKFAERKWYTAMGMAASQARFLGLTARKNNVEFEGQQINQQRTTLANQSASYYNDLLGMSVPTPPSVDSFTKTVYTFNDGALTNEITSLIAQTNGNYKVSYLQQWEDDFSIVSAATSVVNKTSLFGYNIGKNELRTLSTDYWYQNSFNGCIFFNTTTNSYSLMDDNFYEISGSAGSYNIGGIPLEEVILISEDDKAYQLRYDDSAQQYKLHDINDNVDKNLNDVTFYGRIQYTNAAGAVNNINGTYVLSSSGKTLTAKASYLNYIDEAIDINQILPSFGYRGVGDEYFKSLTEEEKQKLLEEEKSYSALLNKEYPNSTGWLVRYVKNSSDGTYKPYFYDVSSLKDAEYDEYGNVKSSIKCYTVGSKTRTEEIKGKDAKVEKDATGRYINITIFDDISDPDAVGVTYSLTTSTITDQDAYEDAMNQYEFDKAKYDQTINEINAKIEIIQAQDKNLELRLKQLDTEQKAISQEMEAVQKVVDKNVDTTFKTFG